MAVLSKGGVQLGHKCKLHSGAGSGGCGSPQVIKIINLIRINQLTQGITEPVKLGCSFSQEWKNRPKVVSFSSLSGEELSAHILKSGKGYIIPTEVLKQPVFCVQIVGKENGNKVPLPDALYI